MMKLNETGVKESVIRMYTDGSCSDGFGGWATLLMFKDKRRVLSGRCSNTNIDRMDIQAILEGFKAIKTKQYPVEVYSNAKSILDCIGKYNHNKKTSIDLWRLLLYHRKGFRVRWNWVKSHSGDKYNDEVDRIAGEERLSIQLLNKSKYVKSNRECI